MSEIKWCGIDFGQCLMEPTGLRTYLVIGDIYKALGQPEKIPNAVKKFREIAEAYGGHSLLKESHRDKIYSYVLENDEAAVTMFTLKEREHLSVGVGAEESFIYMKDRGIEISIVAELKKTLGKMTKNIISQFLINKGLIKYFSNIYTPQGKINLSDNSLDDRYKGRTKQSGELYETLVKELAKRSITPDQMIMVGDKIATDIISARKHGITAVQYTGYIDMGPSEADYRVSSFHELKKIIGGDQ